MVKEKVQPHCMVCYKPFKSTDKVYTDTMFAQIQHAKCFIYKPEFIKDKGTYEEIVNKYPNTKKYLLYLINRLQIHYLYLHLENRKNDTYKGSQEMPDSFFIFN
ncbi:hypothetical protein [Bacillus sp. X1(2014)]|uniref:hypothetical protein n=1 Tax=Bacillus sp. X1(2014) TaxID=1565991 RepID=UPI0011A4A4A9|nr:hypothetical protein [Bacillus sp. X1(2014)]